MPSWGELLIELQPHKDAMGKEIPALSFDDLRCKYIRLLSEKTGRNVISYYSGWLKQNRDQNIDINDSDITGFMNALKGLDCTKGLDLILHTPGGNPTATEGIVKYLRTKFNNDIRVILYHKWQCPQEQCWLVLQKKLSWVPIPALALLIHNMVGFPHII